MTTYAEQLCDDLEVNFTEAFRYQYIITKEAMRPPGMQACQLGKYTLLTGDALPCMPLHDVHGALFGYFFGVAAAHDGRDPLDFLCSSFDSTIKTASTILEDRLTYLAGRFGIIVCIADQTRLYTDASGMIGAVYNTQTHRVAASAGLCVENAFNPHPLYHDTATNLPVGSFGLHYTADARVRRLNPNHFLDLDSLTSQRFWPREHDIFHLAPDEYASAMDEIITAAGHIIRRHVEDNTVSLPLSGGFDSRSILAMTDLESLSKIDQIFTYIVNMVNIRDAAIANQLCHLRHVGLDVFNAFQQRKFSSRGREDALTCQFQIASGNPSPAPAYIDHTLRKVARDSVVLRGQQMPILRGLFMNVNDSEKWTSDYVSHRVIKLLELDHSSAKLKKEISENIEHLIEELPALARERKVDLLFLEVVNGPELASIFAGLSQGFYTSPFNSRRLIQLFCGFDTAYRRSGTAMSVLLLRAAPDLGGVATTRATKRILGAENDDRLQQRRQQLHDMLTAYKHVYGTSPSQEVPMIRYRTDGLAQNA